MNTQSFGSLERRHSSFGTLRRPNSFEELNLRVGKTQRRASSLSLPLQKCVSRISECKSALFSATNQEEIDFWESELKRIEDLQELFECSNLKETRKFLNREVVA
tara:strand:- start:211 stop:525 length:315 start_codon:yes stop_codon:yes gene_type:complete